MNPFVNSDSASADRHWGISGIPALFPPLPEAFEQCPAEKTNSANSEGPNDDSVLDAVSLEAKRHNILFLCILANIKILSETESFRALGACRSAWSFRSEAIVVASKEKG